MFVSVFRQKGVRAWLSGMSAEWYSRPTTLSSSQRKGKDFSTQL